MMQIKKELIEENFKRIRNLVIEVSENCNLACLYCGLRDNYIQPGSSERNKHMDWDTVKLLLDYYIPLWHFELSGFMQFFTIAFYGGEPLLNFELIDKIYQYVEKNRPIDFSVHYEITTNGMLLDKYIDYFVSRNFVLTVSLDGDKRANSFRVDKNGLESFDRLQNILINIKEKYPKYFAENISFQSVINSRSSVIDVFAYFKEVFNQRPLPLQVSMFQLSEKTEIHAIYKNIGDDLRLSKQERKEDFVKFALRDPDISYLEFYFKEFSPYYIFNYSNIDKINEKRLPTATCLPFTYKVFLTVRGLILPCERVGFNKPLGHVAKGKIDIDFQQIADFYNQIFNKYRSLCETCIHTTSCDKCFYHIDYLSEKVGCSDYESILLKEKHIKRAKELLMQNKETYLALINTNN